MAWRRCFSVFGQPRRGLPNDFFLDTPLDFTTKKSDLLAPLAGAHLDIPRPSARMLRSRDVKQRPNGKNLLIDFFSETTLATRRYEGRHTRQRGNKLFSFSADYALHTKTTSGGWCSRSERYLCLPLSRPNTTSKVPTEIARPWGDRPVFFTITRSIPKILHEYSRTPTAPPPLRVSAVLQTPPPPLVVPLTCSLLQYSWASPVMPALPRAEMPAADLPGDFCPHT